MRSYLLLLAFISSAAFGQATISGPAAAKVGAPVEVTVTGSKNQRDFVTIVPKGEREGGYDAYQYVKPGAPVKLVAPAKPGDYEIRLCAADSPYPTLARRALRVDAVEATLDAPGQVSAGSSVSVKWTGPNNERDYIAIGSASRPYIVYKYTREGSPLQLTVPDEPGQYELRYFLGAGDAIIGKRPLVVGSVSASVTAPPSVAAGSQFKITWQGPNNPRDYVTIVKKGTREGQYSSDYEYTARGNPLQIRAPIEPGEYEVRYLTAQAYATLARAPLKVTPGKEEPGFVAVTAASSLPAGNAVEIILDASGSMLQRIGKDRRIDIARQTLTKLVTSTIPANTPFAFRVFGRMEDSCQTDLDVPLGPLNAQAVSAKIAALEPKNGAKTAIGASLELVAADLRAVQGERLVILLTDGEETCGGDPAAAIEKLRKTGTAVRVNIVGFAIDDAKLAETFKHWADEGGGAYFDANSAAALNEAMAQAMRPGFQLVDAQGAVVTEGIAGGEPVRAMPGTYKVRLTGRKGAEQSVTVRAKEKASVQFQ